MNSKFLVMCWSALVVLVACRKQANLRPDQVQETFNMSVELVIPSDEELILYYKDGSDEWFVDDKTIWATVKGSPQVQKVDFNMPQGVLPIDFRLDVGRNQYKGLKSLQIKKVKFSYLDKDFEIGQDQFGMYFSPNQYMSFDSATKTYSFKKDEKGNYDPFFESKPELYPLFAKLVLE